MGCREQSSRPRESAKLPVVDAAEGGQPGRVDRRKTDAGSAIVTLARLQAEVRSRAAGVDATVSRTPPGRPWALICQVAELT